MPEWTFITKHGLVLAQIAKYQQITALEIASAINITERTVHNIITDLEVGGYIDRRRVGRNNFYRINPDLGLKHETTWDVAVGDLLRLLGWRRRRKNKLSPQK